MPTGLPVMKPGYLAPVDGLELVEHPEHVLGIGHDVGGGDVAEVADIVREDPDPAPAELFLLTGAEVVRVADDAALAAAERDVDDGALPGHPHGQSPDGVDRLLGVEADAALAGAAGVVMLAAEAAEHADAAVVHADGIEKWYSRSGCRRRSRVGWSSSRRSATVSNCFWAISNALNPWWP